MKRFNEWLAVKITSAVGTMWCAYVFLALDLIELPPVIKAHSTIVWVSYITQTCLQLVLLPIILVGQNLQTKHVDSHHKAQLLQKERHHRAQMAKLTAIHKHLGIPS